MRHPTLATLAMLAASLSVASCASEPPPLNVLIVCVDTLRADRLGTYGNERPTSPFLDELAEEGHVLERCYSAYPSTQPSVASLLTGLYPSAHRAFQVPAISPLTPRLAQRFRDSGYRTAAVVTNPHLAPGLGFEHGFADYHYIYGRSLKSLPRVLREAAGAGRFEQEAEAYARRVELPDTRLHLDRSERAAFFGRGDAVNERALAWLDGGADAPFFLYLHYMDVHDPYESPEPYDLMFVQGEGRDLYFNGVPDEEVRPEDVAYMQDRYDGQVRWMDHLAESLFAELADRGMLDSTLVVLVSDHGDEFFEHGGFGHGVSLYREQLHVPLIFWRPGLVRPGRTSGVVSTLDVAPTVTDLAGLARNPGQGESLAPLLTGGKFERSDLVFAECAVSRDGDGERRPQMAAIGDTWYLLHRFETDESLLFDQGDTLQADDRAATAPADVEAMRDRARAMRERSRSLGEAFPPPATEYDEAVLEQLRELGYL